jgi:hypothetical protein
VAYRIAENLHAHAMPSSSKGGRMAAWSKREAVMAIDMGKAALRRRLDVALEPVEFYDLEEQLALLERRYAEARSRCQRARDAYHGLSSGAQPKPEPLAAAFARYEAARRVCDSLRTEIDVLESRLS